MTPEEITNLRLVAASPDLCKWHGRLMNAAADHVEAQADENLTLTEALAKTQASLADRDIEVARTRDVLLELVNAVQQFLHPSPEPAYHAKADLRLNEALLAARQLFEEPA